MAAQLSAQMSRKLSPERKDFLMQEKEWCANEVRDLSKQFLRICLRSCRLVRVVNEKDERNFEKVNKRHETQRRERMEDTTGKYVHFVMSTPPVDRVDEVRSRFVYYTSYTMDKFSQNQYMFEYKFDMEEYAAVIRKGEHERQWLLMDIGFEDPYVGRFDFDRLKELERRGRGIYLKFEGHDDETVEEYLREKEAPYDEEDDVVIPSNEPEWAIDLRRTAEAAMEGTLIRPFGRKG
jgi:hypothetical protein